MRLIALQSFVHGEPRRRGDMFDVGERQGHALVQRGLAKPPARPPRDSVLTFVCIASGPSLTREDCEKVRVWREAGDGRRVIVTNTSYQLAPWADILYACDLKWWEIYSAQTMDLPSERWTQNSEAAERFGLRWIRGKRGDGLGRDAVHLGGNSGYQVMNLAYLLGARRVILLGYDMQATGGKSHWHGDHPWANKGAKPPTRGWVPRFAQLAADLAAEGVEVINATRETALQCFARAAIEEAL